MALGNEVSCDAKGGVAGTPVVVEPVPVQDDLVAVIVEIRDVKVVVAMPHRRIVKKTICNTTPRSPVAISELNRILHHNAPVLFTK